MNQKSNINIVSSGNVSPDQRYVLKMLQCKEDNPIYEKVVEIFNEQLNIMQRLFKPIGAFALDEIKRDCSIDDIYPGRKVIYVMSTAGADICDYIDKCMKEDMLVGLIVSYMADSYLFEYEKVIKSEIRRFCIREGIGICKSYEAPDEIPIECQKDTWAILDAKETLGIDITSGYMLNPIKSSGHIYAISDNAEDFNVEHDCSRCSMKECPLR